LSLLVVSSLYGAPLPSDSGARQRADASLVLKREDATLNAQLLDVKVENHPDANHAVLNLSVRFTLRNNLKRTLFVVPEAMKIVGTRFAESADTRSGPYLLDRLRLPSFKQLELLRIKDHRSSHVKALPPETDWEWQTDIPMVLSRLDSKSSYPPEVGLESLQELDAVWCQFEIRFWPHNMEEEAEQLETAWRDHGSLLSSSITSPPTLLAFGANHTTQKSNNHSDDHRVILSLTTESSAIKKGKPFFATLAIKNRSGKDFSFQTSSKPTLNLEAEGQTEEAKKRLGTNYWSWISILTSLPANSEIKRRETLLDGEEISVRLNLSKLDWGHSILSGYPSKSVFPTVPGGRYILYFDFEAREGKKYHKLKSNELNIEVL
jgi:hypothetical protein